MKKVFIITGEYSGDKHAADVAKALFSINPSVEIEAVGGQNLLNTGVKLFCNHEKMSAVGLDFKILFNHLLLGKRLSDYLINDYKPDLVLLIDYGGFNLGISKVLKKAGLKIFYFIPPQIWASRKWRLKTVKKYIDKVLTIFPFEQKMYDEAEIDNEFVGHPLIYQLPDKVDKKVFFTDNNLDPDKKLVSIFPGSRVFEINHLLNIFLDSVDLIRQKEPETQFVICQAPAIKDELLLPAVKRGIKILKGKNYELLAGSDALILASGTVALEAALYNTPMIISYRGPEFFYFVYLLVRCIDKVSLPNIISGKDIIPELIQKKATPKIIAENIVKILQDDKYRLEMTENLSKVKQMLGKKKAAEEVAAIINSNL